MPILDYKTLYKMLNYTNLAQKAKPKGNDRQLIAQSELEDFDKNLQDHVLNDS